MDSYIVLLAYATGVCGSCCTFQLLKPRTSNTGWNNRILLLLASFMAHWSTVVLPQTLLLISHHYNTNLPNMIMPAAMVPFTTLAIWLSTGNPERVKHTLVVLGGFIWVGVSGVICMVIVLQSPIASVWPWMLGAILLPGFCVSEALWYFSKNTQQAVLCGLGLGLSIVASLHLVLQSVTPVPNEIDYTVLKIPIISLSVIILIVTVFSIYRCVQINTISTPVLPINPIRNNEDDLALKLRWIVIDTLKSTPLTNNTLTNNTLESSNLFLGNRILINAQSSCLPVTEILKQYPTALLNQELPGIFDKATAFIQSQMDYGALQALISPPPSPILAGVLRPSTADNSLGNNNNNNNNNKYARPSTGIRWQVPIIEEAATTRRKCVLNAIERLVLSVSLLPESLTVLLRYTTLHFDIVESTLFLVTNLSFTDCLKVADDLVKNLVFKWTSLAEFAQYNDLSKRLFDATNHCLVPLTPIAVIQQQPRITRESFGGTVIGISPPVKLPSRAKSLNLIHDGASLLSRLVRFSYTANTNVFPISDIPSVSLGLVYVRVTGKDVYVLIRKPNGLLLPSLIPAVPILYNNNNNNNIKDLVRSTVVSTSGQHSNSNVVRHLRSFRSSAPQQDNKYEEKNIDPGWLSSLEAAQRLLVSRLGTDTHTTMSTLCPVVVHINSSVLVVHAVEEMTASLALPQGYSSDIFQFIPLKVLVTLCRWKHKVEPKNWAAAIFAPAIKPPPSSQIMIVPRTLSNLDNSDTRRDVVLTINRRKALTPPPSANSQQRPPSLSLNADGVKWPVPQQSESESPSKLLLRPPPSPSSISIIRPPSRNGAMKSDYRRPLLTIPSPLLTIPSQNIIATVPEIVTGVFNPSTTPPLVVKCSLPLLIPLPLSRVERASIDSVLTHKSSQPSTNRVKPPSLLPSVAAAAAVVKFNRSKSRSKNKTAPPSIEPTKHINPNIILSASM